MLQIIMMVLEELNVQFYGFKEEVAINLKTLNGQPFLQQSVTIQSQEKQVTMNLPPKLSEGFYLLHLVGNQTGKAEVVKILVKE